MFPIVRVVLLPGLESHNILIDQVFVDLRPSDLDVKVLFPNTVSFRSTLYTRFSSGNVDSALSGWETNTKKSHSETFSQPIPNPRTLSH